MCLPKLGPEEVGCPGTTMHELSSNSRLNPFCLLTVYIRLLLEAAHTF
jgi:hypothetical protein